MEYYCFIKLRKKNYITVDLIVGVTGPVYLHIVFRRMFVRNAFWFIVLTYNIYTNYSIASAIKCQLSGSIRTSSFIHLILGGISIVNEINVCIKVRSDRKSTISVRFLFKGQSYVLKICITICACA